MPCSQRFQSGFGDRKGIDHVEENQIRKINYALNACFLSTSLA